MLRSRIFRRELLQAGARLASLIGAVSSKQGAQKGLLGPAPSPWFKDLEGDRVRCELCPKKCDLAPGERGLCRVRENRNGKGYSLVFGNPSLIQDDPIERLPFFHVLPGSRVLSISTAGCNLHCKFCEVWDMALAEPEELYAYEMPPRELTGHALSADVRSIGFAFGEPVVFYEYMTETASRARDEGLRTLMHSAGYILPRPLQKLSPLLDAVNIDLKSFDPAFYRDLVGGELKPVLKTLELIKSAGVHIEITNIVIPTLNDDMKLIEKMCKWIASELGSDTPLHFARFYPLYKLSSLPRTPVSTLNLARDTAMSAGLNYVYIARVTGHEAENTFCPGCGGKVIKRMGFVVDEMRMLNGNCADCGQAIAGCWK